MSKNRFWPLDYDPEGAIYENLSWDLPGFRPQRRLTSAATTRPAHKRSKPRRIKDL
jgi:hypothetical protein